MGNQGGFFMGSLQEKFDIIDLERSLGKSHVCHGCGKEFLAYEDGCPNCGRGARTSSLHFLEEGEKWNMESFPVLLWNRIGRFQIVKRGDFSPWPRVEAS